MGTPSNIRDFFIGYSKDDIEWARWIAYQLENAGYTTKYQGRDFDAVGIYQSPSAIR